MDHERTHGRIDLSPRGARPVCVLWIIELEASSLQAVLQTCLMSSYAQMAWNLSASHGRTLIYYCANDGACIVHGGKYLIHNPARGSCTRIA